MHTALVLMALAASFRLTPQPQKVRTFTRSMARAYRLQLDSLPSRSQSEESQRSP